MEVAPACQVAFKEWAAVCAALHAGRQTIVLRKGGIAEGSAGFRPEHAQFWLLPTRFHQQPDKLQPADRRYFDEAQADVPPADEICLRDLAVIAEVVELNDPDRLPALAALHVYGETTIGERFHYRRPGLFLLAVRMYRAPQTFRVPIWPELAGCHSWVQLPLPLSTAGLEPVLDEEAFAQRLAEVRRLVG